LQIDPRLVERSFFKAKGEQWRVPKDRFARALEASADRAFAGQIPRAREVERYVDSLHLEDLALACACAAGDAAAWDHFVLTQRPFLYRAADSLDPSGGSRDLADSLYAELFGLTAAGQERPSLFRYFHGRSSLTTWLRAMLAQRHVDRLRASRRTDPLPEDELPSTGSAPIPTAEPDGRRHLELLGEAMRRATASLTARDRLRLDCYYAQDFTLAQTGKVLGEHEATVSRSLARTRTTIRKAVEQYLAAAGLTAGEITLCLESASEDAGSLDLQEWLDAREPGVDRSN
jgi:RNA polymerase sigma-70 factor (ECF subfamily)